MGHMGQVFSASLGSLSVLLPISHRHLCRKSYLLARAAASSISDPYYLSDYQSTCLFVTLSVCLSVCPYVSASFDAKYF